MRRSYTPGMVLFLLRQSLSELEFRKLYKKISEDKKLTNAEWVHELMEFYLEIEESVYWTNEMVGHHLD